ncbi:MAG: M67 family metallopeptidase [Synechococcales cyanobacterium M58_A2018_015]|nr:M67 family metallopeptidase [Synechococcales cyanobacterium M58_A2018_015]
MVLYLSPIQQQQIASHAEQTYPEECCGLLLGRLERQVAPVDSDLTDQINQIKLDQSRRWLVEVYPAQNTWDAEVAAAMADLMEVSFNQTPDLSKRRHYWIDPQELFAAQRHARQQQLDIIGIYHSHPDHPAVPSESDRRVAWAEYAYVIVSVRQGVAQDMLCWSLDQQQFQPEAMILTPDSGKS